MSDPLPPISETASTGLWPANSRGLGGWRARPSCFALAWFLSLLASWLILRLTVLFRFGPPASFPSIAAALLDGLWRDTLAGIWLTLPLISALAFVHSWGAWTRRAFWIFCAVFAFGQTFLLFVEYFFFEEFRSRFNTVAVDYLQYPTEVFINIWDSYHVGIVLCFCLLSALMWTAAAGKMFSPMFNRPRSPRRPLQVGIGFAALVVALTPLALVAAALAGVMSSPIHPKGSRVSADRTLNEIANNGELALFGAALTHNLDYGGFYKTMPREQAYGRARAVLAGANSKFTGPADTLCRFVPGDSNRPRLNIVILLEESFGSEFWGCLGRKQTLTPEMDKLAATEGMLFTNLYASGNRTVRGMEGVLASFPPLPGESIVKREFSDNVETLARVLKRDDYSTLFLYGGRGVFDGMRSFVLRNGYDRFIEQKHFEHPSFTTVWGVCDEDLYDRSLAEFRDLSRAGRPFFATVLSVSNHKPYTYPRGRIAEDPDQRRRENAVKYADFALGEFFRKARKEDFWTNTIFAVVADHGARVYGEQSIPIHSYEIPLLVLGPAVTSAPARIGRLGCSLDVGPTLLGLVGRPYTSTFFGQDLLNPGQPEGRALLNHNRDIGLLARDRMVVLGLMGGLEYYHGDPKATEMKLARSPDEVDRQLQLDATALFQVADDLYMHQRYRADPDSAQEDDRRKVQAQAP